MIGEGVKEGMFVRNILEFMVPDIELGPIKVLEDNKGSIQLS